MIQKVPGMEQTLVALRAAGEETRLRILILLTYGELSVTELTDILGQSQPRISRHLKLLMEAGLVERMREGAWAFFRLADLHPVLNLMRQMLNSLDPNDEILKKDQERFSEARAQRAHVAQEYFAKIAPEWDRLRSLHVSEHTVEEAVLDLIKPYVIRNFVDLGTGTGKMIQLMAPIASHLAGLDSSHAMLGVARANLQQAGITGVDLRQGDIYVPPFSSNSYDLVCVHQVLHYLDDPARAVREAARLLSPGGVLLIVDFAPHSLEFLRNEQKHRWPGFRHEQISSWMKEIGVDCIAVKDLTPQDQTQDLLTVTIWLGKDRRIITDWPLNTTHQEIA